MYRSGHAKASGGYMIYIYMYTRNCRIRTSLGYIYIEMCRFGNFNYDIYIYIYIVVVATVQKVYKKTLPWHVGVKINSAVKELICFSTAFTSCISLFFTKNISKTQKIY